MKSINDNNIDEIMFGLLEGDIKGIEREQLLEAIKADPAYNALWNKWQQTKLQEDSSEVMDLSLLRRKQTPIIPLYVKLSIAAMIVLALGIGLYFNQGSSTQTTIVTGPVKFRIPSGRNPQIENDTMTVLKIGKDTFVPLREKIRNMALQNKPNSIKADKVDELELDLAIFPPMDNSNNFIDPISPVISETKNTEQPDVISVSVDTEITNTPQNEAPRTLLSRIFGTSRIKIEDDKNTVTKKKIVIENNKYKIIAGF